MPYLGGLTLCFVRCLVAYQVSFQWVPEMWQSLRPRSTPLPPFRTVAPSHQAILSLRTCDAASLLIRTPFPQADSTRLAPLGLGTKKQLIPHSLSTYYFSASLPVACDAHWLLQVFPSMGGNYGKTIASFTPGKLTSYFLGKFAKNIPSVFGLAGISFLLNVCFSQQRNTFWV